jgi:FkbM family methyltransferase
MAEKVGPKGAVHAFEPCPETFAHLELNLALNNFPQVVAQCLALSQTTGEAQLHVFPAGLEIYNSLGAQEFLGNRAEGIITVKTITLDEYCHQKNISRLDFLKIDVEGAESLVLKGGKRTLAENPQMALLIELQEISAGQCGSSVAEGFSLLLAAGFYPHHFYPQGKLVPFSRQEVEITAEGNNPDHNFVFINPEAWRRIP